MCVGICGRMLLLGCGNRKMETEDEYLGGGWCGQEEVVCRHVFLLHQC